MDIGWPLGYMLITVAAYSPSLRIQATRPGAGTLLVDEPAHSHSRYIIRSLLPNALVPPVAGLAIYVLLSGGQSELRFGVLLGGWILIGVILIPANARHGRECSPL